MSENSPNKLSKLAVKTTALVSMGGLGLTGCSVENPNLDDISSCADGATTVVYYDGARLRSLPRTEQLDMGETFITELNFSDDEKYSIEEPSVTVTRDLGDACIRKSASYRGDGNGLWIGVPSNVAAEIFKDKALQDQVKNSPTGYVWTNAVKADIVEA